MNNPSPKARFLSNPTNIKVHRVMVDGDVFQRACDVALLEYQGQCALTIRDQTSAMAVGLKKQGALEVIQTMKTLADVPLAVARKATDNLQPTS